MQQEGVDTTCGLDGLNGNNLEATLR